MEQNGDEIGKLDLELGKESYATVAETNMTKSTVIEVGEITSACEEVEGEYSLKILDNNGIWCN